jgi:hypothetical protein
MSEVLTRKARQAIHTYVWHQAKKHNVSIGDFLIEWTLKADRMPREDLYAYLQKKGYRWNGRCWYLDRINRKAKKGV